LLDIHACTNFDVIVYDRNITVAFRRIYRHAGTYYKTHVHGQTIRQFEHVDSNNAYLDNFG